MEESHVKRLVQFMEMGEITQDEVLRFTSFRSHRKKAKVTKKEYRGSRKKMRRTEG